MSNPLAPGFFDKPPVKKTLWILLWSSCIFFVLLELGIERHGHFGDHSIDSIFGFYALLGFIGCFVCILIAKFLGFFLKVKDDFYDT